MTAQKEKVEELKGQWKKLWQERHDDKVRAEGIATDEYKELFVEKGTIIHATRDYRALNFKEILEQHKVDNAERYIEPHPTVGGWNKFIKNNLTNQQTNTQRGKHAGKLKYRLDIPYKQEKKERTQPKKGGRGWLHQ